MPKITIQRPAAGEYAPPHTGYVNEVPDGDVVALLKKQNGETLRLLGRIGEKKSRHRYAPGKWSIREVVGHMTDTEHVFAYRALRFARGDKTPLPGFDEVAWGNASNADTRTLKSLLEEFAAVRATTLAMIKSFSPELLNRTGTASGHPVSVRGLVYVMAGHERHHVRILKERYLA